jgi:hypothetical protein
MATKTASFKKYYPMWGNGDITADGLPIHEVAKTVFRELAQAYYNNPHFDLVYVLNYLEPRPVSHYVIQFELGWNNFNDYINTLRSLLISECIDS